MVLFVCLIEFLGLAGVTAGEGMSSTVTGWLIILAGLVLLWFVLRAGIVRRGHDLVIRRVGRSVRMPADGTRAVAGRGETRLGLPVRCPVLVMADGSRVPLPEFGRYAIFDRGSRRTKRLVEQIAAVLDAAETPDRAPEAPKAGTARDRAPRVRIREAPLSWFLAFDGFLLVLFGIVPAGAPEPQPGDVAAGMAAIVLGLVLVVRCALMGVKARHGGVSVKTVFTTHTYRNAERVEVERGIVGRAVRTYPVLRLEDGRSIKLTDIGTFGILDRHQHAALRRAGRIASALGVQAAQTVVLGPHVKPARGAVDGGTRVEPALDAAGVGSRLAGAKTAGPRGGTPGRGPAEPAVGSTGGVVSPERVAVRGGTLRRAMVTYGIGCLVIGLLFIVPIPGFSSGGDCVSIVVGVVVAAYGPPALVRAAMVGADVAGGVVTVRHIFATHRYPNVRQVGYEETNIDVRRAVAHPVLYLDDGSVVEVTELGSTVRSDRSKQAVRERAQRIAAALGVAGPAAD